MKSKITKHHILLLIFIFFFTNIHAQDEETKKVIYSVEGKHRTDKFQINKNILLPKGDIIAFRINSLDTTRNYWGAKEIKDSKVIKEVIKLLEKGEVVNKAQTLSNGVGLSVAYKSGLNFDITTSKENVSFYYDYDTTYVLSNLPAFIKKLEKIAAWERFEIEELEIPNSIEITYKKNKKTINDPILIKEFMSCFKGTKSIYPTGCPFNNCRIYFRYKDKVISAAAANDACNTIIISKNYFEMDKNLHKKFVKLLQRYVRFRVGP